MRVSNVLTFIVLALILCLAFADQEVPKATEPVVPKVDPLLQKHVTELNAKIQSLTDDIKTLRSSLDTLRRENENLKKSISTTNERVNTVSNDDVIQNLRQQIEELRVSIAESNLLNQATIAFNKSKVVAERLYKEHIAPSTKVLCAHSEKYIAIAKEEGVKIFGATQSQLSQVYHLARQKLNPITNQARELITKQLIQLNVPREHVTMATQFIITGVYFIVFVFIFMIAYGILSIIIGLLCCSCLRSSPKKSNKPATKPAPTTTNLKK